MKQNELKCHPLYKGWWGRNKTHHLLLYYISREIGEATMCLVLQQPAQIYPTWDFPGVSYPNLGGYTGYLYICSFYQLVLGPFSECFLLLITPGDSMPASWWLGFPTMLYNIRSISYSSLLLAFLGRKGICLLGQRNVSWKGCFNKTSGELGAD